MHTQAHKHTQVHAYKIQSFGHIFKIVSNFLLPLLYVLQLNIIFLFLICF